MITHKSSASHLKNHIYLRTIPLALILLITIMFGFVSNGFSDVVIDDNELVQVGGLCAFSDPVNRTFTVTLTPANINADWTLTPGDGDTVFASGSSNRTSVDITVGDEAKTYTLTVTDGADQDFITLVVGQSARIVSFINEIPDSDWNENDQDYDDANGVAANIALASPKYLSLDRIRDTVQSLDLVDNPTPTFPDTDDWGTFIGKREYRGYIYFQPAAIFNSEGEALCSSLINDGFSNGFTPVPDNVFTIGFLGAAHLCIAAPEAEIGGEGDGITPALSLMNPVDEVTWTWKHRMRINTQDSGAEMFKCMLRLDNTSDIPYVWHEINYRLKSDGDFKVIYLGSDFPSHIAYLNGLKVGEHAQKNLPQVLFIGPVSANGGQFHSEGAEARTFSRYGSLALLPENLFPPPFPNLNITDEFTIRDVNLTVSYTHPNAGELEIQLVAPDTLSLVVKGVGTGLGPNLSATTFDSDAAGALSGSAPHRGVFTPNSPSLLDNLDGDEATGIWSLKSRDGVINGITGSFDGFSLAFNANTFVATSTNATELGSASPGNPVDIPLTISPSDAQVITDIDVSISLRGDNSHFVTVTLISPNGTYVELFSNVFIDTPQGIDKDGFFYTSFDDEASTTIENENPATPNDGGSFQTENGSLDSDDLSKFDGENSAGDWILRVEKGFGQISHIEAFWLNIAGDDFAGPAADNCDAAIEVTSLGALIPFNTTGATGGIRDGSCVNAVSHDVWMKLSVDEFTSCSNCLVVEPVNSDPNIAIAVYQSIATQESDPCSSNLEFVGCYSTVAEDFSFTPMGGTDYYIRVGSTTGAEVAGDIRVRCAGAPPEVRFASTSPSTLVSEAVGSVDIGLILDVPGGGLSANSVSVLVIDELTGLASSAIDYVALDPEPMVTFPAGTPDGTSLSFSVSIINDSILDGNNETIDLKLLVLDCVDVKLPVSINGSHGIIILDDEIDSDPPSIPINNPLTVIEGATQQITSLLLSASDNVTTASAIAYKLAAGLPVNGTLTNDEVELQLNNTFTQGDINSGKISYSHNDSDTTSDSFTFDLLDSSSNTLANQVFSINITPVNDSPSFSPQTRTIDENTGNGTPVGAALIATDGDDGSQTLTFSETGGTGLSVFNITAGGQISVENSAALDFETTTSFTYDVQVTDNGSPQLATPATITINLNNLNDFTPAISDATFSIPESSPFNTVVGTIQAVDGDANETLTFSIAAGDPNDDFEISNYFYDLSLAVLKVKNPNGFNLVGSMTLTIQVIDSGGLTDTAAITINSDSNLFAQSIDLNAGWNIASFNVHQSNSSPQNTFIGLEDNFIRAIEGIKIFDPSFIGTELETFNTLSDIIDGAVYSVNVTSSSKLILIGQAVNPELTFSLKAGWNHIGYILQNTVSVEIALGNLIGNPDFVRAVEGTKIFDPSFVGTPFEAFNTLIEMTSGKAYWLKVLNDLNFNYNVQ